MLFIPVLDQEDETHHLNLDHVVDIFVQIWEVNDSKLVAKVCALDINNKKHDLSNANTVTLTQMAYAEIMKKLPTISWSII